MVSQRGENKGEEEYSEKGFGEVSQHSPHGLACGGRACSSAVRARGFLLARHGSAAVALGPKEGQKSACCRQEEKKGSRDREGKRAHRIHQEHGDDARKGDVKKGFLHRASCVSSPPCEKHQSGCDSSKDANGYLQGKRPFECDQEKETYRCEDGADYEERIFGLLFLQIVARRLSSNCDIDEGEGEARRKSG